MFVRLFLQSVAVLMLAACVATAPSRSPYNADTTFKIETGQGHCSATAVGPHVFLTAGHCVGDLRAVSMDGGRAVEVLGIVRDGSDHALIRVSHTFERWAHRSQRPTKQGQPVYIRGNPSFLDDQLLQGTVSGWGRLPAWVPVQQQMPWLAREFTFYDLPSTGGCSGAAIFDSSGRILAVLSIGIDPLTAPFNLAGSLPLAFTPEQWRQAAK
jgi:S1-C subfamily serine protease